MSEVSPSAETIKAPATTKTLESPLTAGIKPEGQKNILTGEKPANDILNIKETAGVDIAMTKIAEGKLFDENPTTQNEKNTEAFKKYQEFRSEKPDDEQTNEAPKNTTPDINKTQAPANKNEEAFIKYRDMMRNETPQDTEQTQDIVGQTPEPKVDASTTNHPATETKKSSAAPDGVVAQINERLANNPGEKALLEQIQDTNKKIDAFHASHNPDGKTLEALEKEKIMLTSAYEKLREAPAQTPKVGENSFKTPVDIENATQNQKDESGEKPVEEKPTEEPEKQQAEDKKTEQKDEQNENPEAKKQIEEINTKLKAAGIDAESQQGKDFLKNLSENPDQMEAMRETLDLCAQNKENIENSEELKKLGINTSELAKTTNKAMIDKLIEQLAEKTEKSTQELKNNPDPQKQKENEEDSILLKLLKALGVLLSAGAAGIAATKEIEKS